MLMTQNHICFGWLISIGRWDDHQQACLHAQHARYPVRLPPDLHRLCLLLHRTSHENAHRQSEQLQYSSDYIDEAEKKVRRRPKKYKGEKFYPRQGIHRLHNVFWKFDHLHGYGESSGKVWKRFLNSLEISIWSMSISSINFIRKRKFVQWLILV